MRFFDNLNSFVDLGVELVDGIASLGEDLDPSIDLSGEREEYENDAKEAKEALADARKDLLPYRITICTNHIKNGYSFDFVKSQLQSAFSGTLNVMDERDGDDGLSVFVGFDLLSRTGKVYVLTRLEGEMDLITASAEER